MFLAQLANTGQLPALPEGPSIDRVRGPIEIPAYETWQIALAIVLGVLLLAGIAWLLLRIRRQAKPAATPPYDVAIEELDAASKLTNEDDERFAILCSQALRRYLETGLNLKFSARTSEEFLHSLKGNTTLGKNYQQELKDVLSAFDKIKFARQEVSKEQRSEILNTVRSLIKQAHETTQQEGGKT